jgi:hypothetical protein
MRSPGEIDPDQARAFLTALYGNIPDGHRLLLWRLPGKLSLWFNDMDDLLRDLQLISGQTETDLYIGCGTRPFGLHVTERGTAEQVLGIPGVWADVDLQSKGHENNPADLDTLLRWARALDPAPSHIVSSGHGLHLWWSAPFWAFEDAEDRARAAATVRGFQDWLRTQAPDWRLDATHSLDRVLRLPGTWNWKQADHPQPVELLA